ncbi:MAG: hypothetical protein WBG30_10190 [Psychrilyobacter sp.]|uniref:amylo-alpha-1,6-glucosidase n=1 Tax=Psychrilyobacter sp. TaxID=2586924 RepID=UPI003C71803F
MFDISKISFSRYNSYLAITNWIGKGELGDGIYIRSVKDGDLDLGNLFLVELIDEEVISFTSSPELLTIYGKNGSVQINFPRGNEIRIKGQGVGIKLTLNSKTYDNAIPSNHGKWEINSYSKEIKIMAVPIEGVLEVNAPWEKDRCKKVEIITQKHFSLALDFYKSVWIEPTRLNFNDETHKIKMEFDSWKSKGLKNKGLKNELAKYCLWSSIVSEDGILKRKASYMSMNWMTNIWSWDNCFAAMSLLDLDPKLAIDQILIFGDLQDENGAFPDFANNMYSSFSCSKPPIHGWALKWMYERNEKDLNPYLDEIYNILVKWTNYWLKHKTIDEIPYYTHGNDSGWDNSTLFIDGAPLAGPDLLTFLILQCDTLSFFGKKLNKPEDEIDQWVEKSNNLLNLLLNKFYKNKKFIGYRYNGDNFIPVEKGDSLVVYMPILLGKKLPSKIRDKIIEELKDKNRFLTKFGLSTESKESKYYKGDGYWRGPIWAPTTMLFIDGILRSGDTKFANDLAKRYCNLIDQFGLNENHNSITGEGQRDDGFNWTSSVYLILNNYY